MTWGMIMRVVVAGGAGFVGSNLCAVLLDRGDQVVCVDNLSTGRRENVAHLSHHSAFEFIEFDVTSGPIPVFGPVDAVANLASPASPPDYLRMPLETLSVGSRGTENCLELSRVHGARFMLASTSEVYGDPLVHPQDESYWGNVNPIGPRSVYDEAKRYAEAVTTAYRTSLGVNTGIIRIFNTYGPQMREHDGRVVSSFISQALNGEPLTVFGDGSQTRSFCYVDDLVRGIVAMLDSDTAGPVNLGNPNEMTVRELADLITAMTDSDSPVNYLPLPQDDPMQRKPVITRAQELLGWTPEVSLEDGLRKTIDYFASEIHVSDSISA
jgi:dTDP-glucose 4,6-dehydratase